MATIRKRGTAWHCQVRRAGYPPQTRTFLTKKDAEQWARSIELTIDRRGLVSSENPELSDVLDAFAAECLPRYKGNSVRGALPVIRAAFSGFRLLSVTADHVRRWAKAEAEKKSAQTVKHYLSALSAVYRYARETYNNDYNPLLNVAAPTLPPGRSRRLDGEEKRRLFSVLPAHPRLYALVLVLIETGLRCGEALALTTSDVNFDARIALVKGAKDPRGRYRVRAVPLSLLACQMLLNCSSAVKEGDRLFNNWVSSDSIQTIWHSVLKAADITDYRIHDLRHEAISRLVEQGFSDTEVMAIAGHLSHAMLARYAHLRPSTLLPRLDAIALRSS